jgi:CheY-like chemotaxis protein
VSLRILFVDDDALQQDRFQDAIADWNAANAPRTFTPIIIDNPVEAAEALQTTRFDCALFDLKLAAGEGQGNLSGNQLARTGLAEVGMPVGIISGFPEDAAEDLQEGHLVRIIRKKAGAFAEAVNWFGGLWDMMEVLAATRRRIRRSGAEIFASRVWPRWDAYRDVAVAGGQLEPIITRQYAGHIAELLGVDGGENPDWHPIEAYIYPAFQDDRAHTGDVFRLDDELWVVLSPPCDMAARVDDVLLAKCTPDLSEAWDAKVARLRQALAAGEVSNSLKTWFTDHINQNNEISKHFLPPLDGQPLQVDFKRLAVRPLAELEANLGSRRASIAPAFLTNLTQRFGAYISRTGQPNIGIHHFADPPGSEKPGEADV